MSVHRPYRLGTVTSGAIVADPPNAVGAYTETRTFTVAVPGLPNIQCEVARKEPGATEIGTILCFSGSAGKDWNFGTATTEQWVADLVAAGYRVIQTRWQTDGWLQDTSDSSRGLAYCAARPATILKYLHTTHVAPNVANLIVFAQSAGGSQVGYSVSHYHLGPLISHILFNGGPAHVDLLRGCDGVSATYDYTDAQADDVDSAWVMDPGAGPCQIHNAAAMGSVWAFDSMLQGALKFPPSSYAWGTADTTVAPAHGELLAAKQDTNGTSVLRGYLEAAVHDVHGSLKGRTFTRDVIEARPVQRQSITGALFTSGASSLALTGLRTPKAGNLLVVVHRAQTLVSSMSPPSGFAICNGDSINAEIGVSTGVRVYFKAAVGNEAATLAVTTLTSVAQAVDVFEVQMRGQGTWQVDKVDLTTESPVSVITLGPTNTPTTAKQWCVGAIDINGTHGGMVGVPTNGYVEQSAVSGQRLITVAKAIDTAAAQSTVVDWTTTRTASGVLVTFKCP